MTSGCCLKSSLEVYGLNQMQIRNICDAIQKAGTQKSSAKIHRKKLK